MSTAFTKVSLEQAYRPISDLINGKLPDRDGLLDPAVAGLLKAGRAVYPHSKDTRVLQFHINARAQPTIFHPHHFKYAVQYDPFGTIGDTAAKNFVIEFYMSKIRIYHEREAMVSRVRRELARLRLSGFEFRETERSFCYDHKFAASTESQLLGEVRAYLFPLINAVHPTFYRIMDAFNVTMTKDERRAVISGRERINPLDRSSPNYGKNMAYRREVSPALRKATFERDAHTCQHCEKVFPKQQLHADHVIPIARSGLTVLGNLQSLCGPCNLKKGKRLESELAHA